MMLSREAAETSLSALTLSRLRWSGAASTQNPRTGSCLEFNPVTDVWKEEQELGPPCVPWEVNTALVGSQISWLQSWVLLTIHRLSAARERVIFSIYTVKFLMFSSHRQPGGWTEKSPAQGKKRSL